jgi:hypothetical protein
MKKIYFATFSLIIVCHMVVGQNYRSRQNGNWNNASTWQVFVDNAWVNLESPLAAPYQNILPTASSGTISVDHNVLIPSPYSVTIDQTTVSSTGRIDVRTGGSLAINTVSNALVVDGEIVARDLSSIIGTAADRVIFNNGSIYYHFFTTTEGTIPLASWDEGSVVQISGYTTFASATSAANWNQSYGTLMWNCTNQTGTVSLNGLIRTIKGDLRIVDTNGQTLQLSTTQRPVVNIAGDLNIEGNSVVDFNTTALTMTVNVQGDFNFTPTNSGTTQLTTTGATVVNVYGDFEMDAVDATLNLANSTGSTGTGTLYLRGDFRLISGTIKEGSNDAAASTGRIWFTNTGSGLMHNFINTGIIQNRIGFRLIQASDTLRVFTESQLIGHTGSTLTVNGGVLLLESEASAGALQLGSGTGEGNIRVSSRSYGTGTRIIYGGQGPQVIGNGQSASTSVVIDNPSGVTLNNPNVTNQILAGLTILNGDLLVENNSLTVSGTGTTVGIYGGDLIMNSGSVARTFAFNNLILDGGNIFVSSGSNTATFTVNGNIDQTAGDITITSGTAAALFTFQGDITGTGNFYFSGDNSRLSISGSGALSRPIPITTSTNLKLLVINRPGATVILPEPVIVSTDVSVAAGNLITSDLEVGDDLNIKAGYYVDFSNSTLTLYSGFNNVYTGGSLTTNAGSVLKLPGTGSVGTLAFTVSPSTIGKIILDRPTSGTLVTLNSDLTVQDSLNLNDGIFNNILGLTMANGSVILRNSAASLTGLAPAGGPYNLLYQGTTLTTAAESQGSIENFTSECTGTVTLASAIASTGIFTISSGILTAGVHAISAMTLMNDGTLDAPSTTLTLAGDLINNGVFNKNSGTVIFDGVATVGGSSSTVFHSVTISAQGELTPPATFEMTGHFSNNGVFNDNNGLILLSGTARQDLTGIGTTLNNITVTNSASPYSVSVDGEFNLRGTLTLSAGTQFLADGVSSNGIFTVLSLNDQPSTTDGRIAEIPASAAVLGNVTVQRFMEGKTTRVNRYISSPVTGATVDDITSDYPVSEVKWYDETVSGDMINGYTVANGSDVLESGRGYLALPVTSNVTATWDVRGPLTAGENQGSVNFGITHTPSDPVDVNGDGWNLVGNPYASGIGWGINSGWTRSNIGATITVRDLGGPSPKYKTYTYNGTDGTGTLPNGVIAMGQAFWVWAAPGGGTLIVHESAKTAMSGTFYRERSPLSKQLIIALKNENGDEDNTFLKTNQAATEDFDIEFDAYQLKNEFLNISIYDKNSRGMLMHTLSNIPDDFVAPVEIAVSAAGQYTVSFDYADQFLSGTELYFVDELEQVATPIHVNGSSYTFNIQSAVVDNSRFRLKRKPEFENKGEFSVQLFPNPVSTELVLRTRGAKEVAVAVMDMKGNVLMQRTATNDAIFNVADLPKGMYIVRVVSQDNVVVRKIVKE